MKADIPGYIIYDRMEKTIAQRALPTTENQYSGVEFLLYSISNNIFYKERLKKDFSMLVTVTLRLLFTFGLLLSAIECFVVPHRRNSVRRHRNRAVDVVREIESPPLRVHMCDRINTPVYTALRAVDNDESTTKNTLSSLGYTEEEIQRSQNRELRQQNGEKLNVQVNLLPDIDSVTLTALGFALIAFNFFVLGNLEDGGIAGVVATIINTLSQ